MASGIINNGFIKFGFSDDGTLGYGGNVSPGIFYDSTGSFTYPSNADFLTPGSPRESFSIKIGSTVYSNRNESYTSPAMPTTVSTSLTSAGGKTYGSITVVSNKGGLQITQVYSVGQDDTIINMSVTVKNTTNATINNVKYSRGIDPDVDSPLGTTSTINSRGGGGASANDLVLSEGPKSHRIIGFYSNDPMAHNTSVTSNWSLDPDDALSGRMDGTGDYTINIGFNLGNLAAGQSKSFNFAYVFVASPSKIAEVIATVPASNPAPTFTAFDGSVVSGAEDSQVTITHADLLARGNEADKNADGSAGSVPAFVVKAVSSGVLRIGATEATATAWAPNSNDVIDATHNAYWTPAANANGNLNAFTVVARDAEGAVSAAPVQAVVNVSPVNDAPSFTSGAVLTPVLEDAAAPAGQTIASMMAPRFVDVDAGASLAGVVVVANAAAPAEGKWTYSTDGGATWHDIGNVSAGAGLVLPASAKLRFEAEPNWNGTPGALSVLPVDNAYAGGFSSGPTRVSFDSSTDPDTSGVGAVPVEIGTSIVAVNDAPVFTSAPPAAIELTETSAYDDALAAGKVALAAGSLTGTLSASDVDHTTHAFSIRGGTAGAGVVTKAGFFGTLTLDSATGAWTYTPTNFTAINALADGVKATETFDLKVSDPEGAFSTQALTVTVTGSNDLPVLASALADQNFSGAGTWSYQLPADSFTDADGTPLTYSVQLVDSAGNPVGDGSLPAWLSFDEATRTFTGDPDHAWNNADLHLRVSASDGSAAVNDTFKLSLSNTGNQGPVLNKAPLPQVVSDVREQVKVSFSDAPGGASLVFDGKTVTLGSAATAAEVASAVASGSYAGWNAAVKGSSADTVVFTAKTAGAIADVANVVGAGSYTGTPTITKITDGQNAVPGANGSFVLNLSDANFATMIGFGGTFIPLNGHETSVEVGLLLRNANYSNWTVSIVGPTQVKFIHKTDKTPPAVTVGDFGGDYADVNLGDVTVSNPEAGVADTPAVAEVFEVAFTSAFGGGTLVFDGATVTAGSALSASQVADAVVAAGATANWTVAADAAGSVSYTAKTAGDKTLLGSDFGGSYAGATVGAVTQGAGWTYQLPVDTFVDPENNPLTYTAMLGATDLASGGSAALSFDPATRTFSGDGSPLPAGAITVTATDAVSGGSASTTVALTLNDRADAGVSAGVAPADVTWTGAGQHSYHLPTDAFVFADGGAPTLSATLANGDPLPAWLRFDAATGTFSGNPPAGAAGSLSLRVTASESSGASSNAHQTINLAVVSPDDAPVLVAPLPDIVADTSGNLSINVGKLLFSDPDGNADGSATTSGITYSAALAGGGALPAWLSFDPATATFTGNPPAGTPYLNIVVTGSASGASASTSFTLGLTSAADAATATNSAGSLLITGSAATLGNVLSAAAPEDDDGIAGAVAYQWQVSADGGASWADIGGARGAGATFALTLAESGKQVRAVAFYNDAGGVAEAPASNAIAVPTFNIDGDVTLTGTTAPGQTLNAVLRDDNGLTAATPAYQWQVSSDGNSWTDIAGATYSAYTLQNGDGGKYVRVNVSYTDDEGTLQNVSKTSAQVQLGAVAPVAVDDSASATEAGGVANGSGGANASGNLLANDTDANAGDTRTVTGVRSGAIEGAGENAEPGADGFVITGLYGTLTVKADGSYTYVVDQTNFAVNALNTGGTLSESFNYTVTDGSLLSDSARLTVTINGANDAPTVIFAPASFSVVEDLRTGFVMPSLFSLSDVDGGSAFSVQLVASAGTLSGVSGAGVTVSGNDSATLTLTGTLAAVNSWLKTAGNAFYTSAPNANGLGAASIAIRANDGGGYMSMGDPIRLDIVATNDAPVLDLDADNSSGADGNDFVTIFRPRGEAVAVVDGDVTISDIDAGAVLAGARVAITGGAWDNDFGTTYETLFSTAGNSYAGSMGAITISGNGAAALVLSGAGTMADYQNALKTVRYENANPNAFAGDRTITISVTDASAAKLVTLTAANASVGTGMSVLLGGVDTGATVTQVIDGTHFVTSSVVAGLAGATALSFATGATAAGAVSAASVFSTVELNEGIAVGQHIWIDGADSGLTVTAVSGSSITASGALTLADGAVLSFRTSATAVLSGMASNGGSFATAAGNNLIAVGQKIYIGGVDSGQTVATVLDNQHFIASGPLKDLTPTSALQFYRDGALVTSAVNAAPLAATTTIKTPWTPVVDLDGAASSGRDRVTTFTEGQSGVAISSSDASITDQDGNLKSVTIRLTNPADGSAERLSVADSLKANLQNLGITTTISSDGHTVTFSGDRDATYYQLGLRGVQYQNASENPGVTPRIVTVSVIDQDNNLGVDARTTINVVPVNDAPVIATNTGAAVLEGGSITLGAAQLSSTDVDDTAASLDYVLTGATAKGTLFRDLNGNGQVDSGEALGVGGKFNQGELSAGIVKYVQHDTLAGSATPYGSDSFSFRVQDGMENGVVAPSGSFTIAITPVNDAPLLSAIAANPTFSEHPTDASQGAWATLFSGAAVNPVENDQNVIEVRFRVDGVADGSAEKLRIDGQEIALTGSNGTTSAGSFGYAVTVSGGVASITISKAGAGASAWADLLNTIAYRNTSNAPSGSTRSVTLTQVKDSGGTTNGGVDTTTLNLSSSVAIVVSDTPPQTPIVNTGASVANGGTVTLGIANLAMTDADSAAGALKYTVTSAATNGTLFRDANGNGQADAGETLGAGSSFTQADLIAGSIKYRHNGENGASESFRFTAGDAHTTLPEASFAFSIAPATVATGVGGGGVNSPSTDGRTPLFDGVTIKPSAGDTVGTLRFSIDGVKDGAHETLRVNGQVLELVPGTRTVDGIVYTVSDDGNGNITVTVTDPTAPGFTGAQAESIVAGARYSNDAAPPTPGLRQIGLEAVTIDAGGAPTGTHPVEFEGSVMINPTRAPFTGADLPAPAAGKTIGTLTFEVGSVTDGNKEVFKVNGRELPLVNGSVTDGDIVYTVAVDADGKAVITVTDRTAPGFSEAEAEYIVQHATYVNNAVPPTGAPRSLTLVSQTEVTTATPPVPTVVPLTGFTDTFTPASANSAPVLAVGPAATLLEGGVHTLSLADVSATDAEQSGGSLLFRLDSAPQHGVLFRDSNGNGLLNSGEALAAGATFTQADVAAGRIKYLHDGNEGATDSLAISVGDGVVRSTAGTLNLAITGVNDAPTLAASALNPAWVEGAPAASLFGSAATGGVEAGQLLTSLALTVAQLRDGSAEHLVVNGVAIDLSGATASGSLGSVGGVALGYTVSFAGGSASVRIDAPAGISQADLAALVNGIAYENTSANPSNGARIITLTALSDNGGTANSGLDTAALGLSSSVTVSAVNTAPTLSSPGITVLEGGSLTLGTSQINAVDPDSPLASLSYTLDTAPSAGTVYLDANNNGVLDDGEALGANARFSHADLTGGRVRYQHDGSENGDSFSVRVSDGSAQSGAVPVTVTRTPVNDAPVLGNLQGTTLAYPANSGPKLVDALGGATVTDPDSANFAGGNLRVSVQFNNDAAHDVLSVRNIGSGAGQIGVSGNTVSYGGVAIGTVAGGSGANDLVITLNGVANAEATAALIRAVQFSNNDANPALPSRSIGFTLSDGQGGVSQTTSVNVTIPANAQPIILNGSGFYVAENTTAVTVLAATDPNGRPVTFSISGGADAARFVINPTTGELRFAAGPDFENPGDAGANNVYDVVVRATNDQGSYSESALAVNVVDVANETVQDEAAPVFAVATVTGNQLVMRYTDMSPLDAVNVPAAGAFSVTSDGAPLAVTAVAIDAAARTVTLTLASNVRSGAAVTVAYADPTAGNDLAALQDASGNDAASLAPSAVINLTPSPATGGGGAPANPPVVTPGELTNIVKTVETGANGSTVTSNTGMIGSVKVVETVVTGADGKIEKTLAVNASSAGVTNLPLLYEAGGTTASNTTVSLSAGVSLTSLGARTPVGTDGALDLIELIKASVQDSDSLLGQMIRGGQNFLNNREASSTLWVNKLTLDSSGSGDAPVTVTVNGAANNSQSVTTGDKLEGLVIDASKLKPGSTLELRNVDFAVVIGDNIKIRGGDGANVVYGGAGSQDIMLGADDDILFGGDGDDIIGSGGGNDMIYGNAGNDVLFGGLGLDVLHGGSGKDVAVYEGNMDRYSITRDHGKTIVRSLDRLDDIDTLVNVETIRFADQSYTIESSKVMEMLATGYGAILGRQADLNGFQFWAKGLDAATVNAGTVALFLLNSAEFAASSGVQFGSLSRSAQVDVLYTAILDRKADAAGHAFWMNLLDKGMSMETVAAHFMESAELVGQYSVNTEWEFFL